MYTIVGLGNPGEEYENSRHNTGRMVVRHFAHKHGFSEWGEVKKYIALVTEGKVGPLDSSPRGSRISRAGQTARGKQEKVLLLLPETFMNKSGSSLSKIITSKKKAEQLVVVYDDIDLPLGTFKISFGRGSGGHRGVESIIRKVKTKNFIRVRVGITPTTPSGKLKKPKGEKKVLNFILGDFKTGEQEVFKKILKKVNDALLMIITEDRARAMNKYN